MSWKIVNRNKFGTFFPPHEDRTFSGSLVLGVNIWWSHLQTLFNNINERKKCRELAVNKDRWILFEGTWGNFHPGNRDLGRKKRDLGNRTSPASHMNTSKFLQRREWQCEVSETEIWRKLPTWRNIVTLEEIYENQRSCLLTSFEKRKIR